MQRTCGLGVLQHFGRDCGGRWPVAVGSMMQRAFPWHCCCTLLLLLLQARAAQALVEQSTAPLACRCRRELRASGGGAAGEHELGETLSGMSDNPKDPLARCPAQPRPVMGAEL
jgi:hypothetical protein